jgi:hypothetical protein
MAGTATNYQPTLIRAGSIAQVWGNLAIPAAGARLTLDTDGTPDATANPSAVHLGMTEAGAMFKVKPTFQKFLADEFASPVKNQMDALEATIEAAFLQIMDEKLLQVLTVGFGTYATDTGYKEVALGIAAQTYTSLALIFPTEADKTKFGVFHLYKTNNTGGLDSIDMSRKKMSSAKAVFEGLAIPGRAATDSVGKYWWQI